MNDMVQSGQSLKVAVVGTGYVGLVTGTCFAEMGNEVICVDIDADKVARMRSGQVPIFEPGLELLFERNLREGRLQFTTDLRHAVEIGDAIFLALPTPMGAGGAADLSAVLAVARELGTMLAEMRDADGAQGTDVYKVIINKSTVPVGTADRVRDEMESAGVRAGVEFDVVSNPEFLREGRAVEDFLRPERVVLGTSSKRAEEVMVSLYEPFVRNGNPIHTVDERSAELTKYAANAFLATKITFMNEIANLCERVGANVDHVRRGIGSDTRIGKQFLYPGIGYGGSCFPKDVNALAHTAAEHGYGFDLLRAVIEVNDRQPQLLVERIVEHFGSLAGRRFAVWGLAFKADTDDVRESPAHHVIRGLLDLGATVAAFDPEAIETTRTVLGDTINYATDAYEILDGADALIVCTEWNEFRRPDFDRIRAALKQPVIFDGRNLYHPQHLIANGFTYFSVGRPQQDEMHRSESRQAVAVETDADVEEAATAVS